MPAYTVVFSPEAEAQLLELYGYIADRASPEIAARFTDGIVAYCESLATFPLRESGETIFGRACALRTFASA